MLPALATSTPPSLPSKEKCKTFPSGDSAVLIEGRYVPSCLYHFPGLATTVIERKNCFLGIFLEEKRKTKQYAQ